MSTLKATCVPELRALVTVEVLLPVAPAVSWIIESSATEIPPPPVDRLSKRSVIPAAGVNAVSIRSVKRARASASFSVVVTEVAVTVFELAVCGVVSAMLIGFVVRTP